MAQAQLKTQRAVRDWPFKITPLHPVLGCEISGITLALDPSHFQPLGAFKAEVDRHVGSLRNSQALPGNDVVRLPGEQRAQRRANRLRVCGA